MNEQSTSRTPEQARGGASDPAVPTKRRVADDLRIAAGTAAVAGVVWGLWTQVGDVALEVKAFDGGSQSVGVISVLVSTVVLVLAGGALLRWMQGRSSTGLRRWTQIAVGFALISLITTTSALTAAAGLGLASLHLVVAAVAIPWLRHAHRPVASRDS